MSIAQSLSASAAERSDQAIQLRRSIPRSSHADWSPPPDRADPVDILEAQARTRVAQLIPLRYARMAQSPFAFYRGTAAVMAADLASSPTTGFEVQLCGDAHMANFGTYASPERQQVFDMNDFDETLPGPWEWDVKRLAASAVLAGRANGFDASTSRSLAVACVLAYAESIRRFAGSRALDVWYAHASLEDILQLAKRKAGRRSITDLGAKAKRRTSDRLIARLVENVGGELRFRTDPPLVTPLRELETIFEPTRLMGQIEASFASYVDSLQPDRRRLLSRYSFVDLALKVVGVGSVGTRCIAVLMVGADRGEPLVLQVKEASASVLAAHLSPSRYEHHGERVVQGQRLIQATSDIFLGWSVAGDGPHYYWRQMADKKGSVDTTTMDPQMLTGYSRLCGWTLAHAHARAGDSIAISAYLGSGRSFSEAIGTFAMAYADQAEQDHRALLAAIASGRVQAADHP